MIKTFICLKIRSFQYLRFFTLSEFSLCFFIRHMKWVAYGYVAVSSLGSVQTTDLKYSGF